MLSKLYKAQQVADILGISKSKAHELMRSKSMEVVRFGRNVRVTEEALEKFIEENKVPPQCEFPIMNTTQS